jgi:fluoride exporter
MDRGERPPWWTLRGSREVDVAYVLAAVGGVLGALSRWGVAEALPRSPTGWPWATLLANLVGCLLMGVLLARLAGTGAPWVQPLVGAGVLGGFTTYSAFAVETVQLVEAGALLSAAGYAAASMLGGVLAVAVGLRLGGGTAGEAGPAGRPA